MRRPPRARLPDPRASGQRSYAHITTERIAAVRALGELRAVPEFPRQMLVMRASAVVCMCTVLGACSSAHTSSPSSPPPPSTTLAQNAARSAQRSTRVAEATAVCKELVVLNRRDNAELTSDPGAAAKMWATYLSRQVPTFETRWSERLLRTSPGAVRLRISPKSTTLRVDRWGRTRRDH